MQLVHRGQVLTGLSIALESRLFKLNLLWHFLSFLLVDHLENNPLSIFVFLVITHLSNHRGTMLWQKSVRESALLVTHSGDDVLRLFRHLVQKQVDHAQTSLPGLL